MHAYMILLSTIANNSSKLSEYKYSKLRVLIGCLYAEPDKIQVQLWRGTLNWGLYMVMVLKEMRLLTSEDPPNCTTSNQVTITTYVGVNPVVLKYVCTSFCALERTPVSLVSRNDMFPPCASAQNGAINGGVESVGKFNGKLCGNGSPTEINPFELACGKRRCDYTKLA